MVAHVTLDLLPVIRAQLFLHARRDSKLEVTVAVTRAQTSLTTLSTRATVEFIRPDALGSVTLDIIRHATDHAHMVM